MTDFERMLIEEIINDRVENTKLHMAMGKLKNMQKMIIWLYKELQKQKEHKQWATTKQNKDKTMKFMIIARYFFYAGTLTDKKNGALRNYDSKKITT